MGCQFREIKYEKVRQLGIKDKSLIFAPNSSYYTLADENTIKSIIAVKTAKNSVKLQANYTFPEYRNQVYLAFAVRYGFIQRYEYLCRLFA